jgi:HEAT repeat protein
VRPLLLVSVLLSAPASAQAPGAPPPAGAPPLVAAPADADRALLAATSAAVEPAPLEVRVLAVEELGLLGDTRAVPLLRRLLISESQPALQRAAVRALRALGTPEAVSVLDEGLRTGRLSYEAARELVAALPYLRWEAARAALAWAAANAATYEVRAAAQSALARFGPPPAFRDARLEDVP